MTEFNLSEKRSPEMMKKLFVYSEEDVKEFIQKLEDFRPAKFQILVDNFNKNFSEMGI